MESMRIRPLLSLCGAALTAAMLTSCAGDPNSTLRPADATAPLGGVSPLGTADSGPKTQRPEAPGQLTVSDIRVGHHEGFERVVFDFEGEGEPGWFIDYVSHAAHPVSGEGLNVKGQAFLLVNIDGVEEGKNTPNLSMSDESANIPEILDAGITGSRHHFVIGLHKEAPYSVEVLEDPLRLVIDIRA
ncbi:putative secreted protein [Corynebacterium pilosum]|uniref:Putative secreted protein n=2 Tax=Corynebacterium pilosum TaxID=35756 RepID=A0A376CN71_9CORY|nr:putative secreted protein [Corynebacterium pilosum]